MHLFLLTLTFYGHKQSMAFAEFGLIKPWYAFACIVLIFMNPVAYFLPLFLATRMDNILILRTYIVNNSPAPELLSLSKAEASD